VHAGICLYSGEFHNQPQRKRKQLEKPALRWKPETTHSLLYGSQWPTPEDSDNTSKTSETMYVYRNNEGRLRIIVACKSNYVLAYLLVCVCTRGLACVHVALLIHHTTHMRHIVT
jgi:hypothetical protein